MNKQEFDAVTKAVDDALGNPKMTWEGPEPHDFRRMKERGVRLVHSDLFFKVPDPLEDSADYNYATDGKVYFKILCGDDSAAADMGARLVAAGFVYADEPWPITPNGHSLSFTVAP